MKEKLKRGLSSAAVAGTALYLTAPVVWAQQNPDTAAIDVADVKTKIMNQIPVIALIGGGVLLIIVAVQAFKWVRAALR